MNSLLIKKKVQIYNYLPYSDKKLQENPMLLG